MASVRNRNGVWQARILRKEQPAVSKSFQTRQDAERWARHIETQIDKGSYTSVALAENTTFAEVVERYIAEAPRLFTQKTKRGVFQVINAPVPDRFQPGAASFEQNTVHSPAE